MIYLYQTLLIRFQLSDNREPHTPCLPADVRELLANVWGVRDCSPGFQQTTHLLCTLTVQFQPTDRGRMRYVLPGFMNLPVKSSPYVFCGRTKRNREPHVFARRRLQVHLSANPEKLNYYHSAFTSVKESKFTDFQTTVVESTFK